jgi:putative spermidine/putrescine transport system permease protein
MGNSLTVALFTALISLAVGAPAGRVLGLYAFRGKDLISVMLTIPIIVPPLSVAMGLHLWFLRLGLTETFAGVVAVHLTFCLPYSVFVMWGVFSNYNKEFEEQARSLGASGFQVVFRVMLPLVFPGLVVAGLFSFLLSWSQYLSTLIIGGGEVTTLPILLFALMGSGDRPVAASVSLVFVAPALLALLLSARYLGGRGLKGIH